MVVNWIGLLRGWASHVAERDAVCQAWLAACVVLIARDSKLLRVRDFFGRHWMSSKDLLENVAWAAMEMDPASDIVQ